jgi:hypothetical protein
LNKNIAEVGLTQEPGPLRQIHVIIHSDDTYQDKAGSILFGYNLCTCTANWPLPGNDGLQQYEGLAEHEVSHHLERLLEQVAKAAQKTQDGRPPMDPVQGCQCVGDTCGCCANINLPALKINATGKE